MTSEPLAPHTARNHGPILNVLREELRDVGDVLEIGSGNGQHATLFAAELSHLRWQTSELDENHAAINRWLAGTALQNVLPPISLDVMTANLPANSYDAAFSANTAHIMHLAAVEKMFALVALVLRAGGVFCLYGPFRQNSVFNADSNSRFHESLRGRDSAMGIRHLEELDRFAAVGGLTRQRLYAMPANNYVAIWLKGGETSR